MCEDDITLNLCRDDLNSDISVRESHYKAVLWCIVLVLCLDGKSPSSLVVGLAFSSASVLDLVSTEVGAVLVLLDERHLDGSRLID